MKKVQIEVDEDLLNQAMRIADVQDAGKAIDQALKLMVRKNHYQEVLKWRGKLHWDDQPSQQPARFNPDAVIGKSI